jgi:hypothetical protein
MKSSKSRLLLVLFLGISLVSINIANSQSSVPPEVASITNLTLEEGQAKLTSLGYEICSSSFFSKKQDWFNESTENCVTIKFNKKDKQIIEVLLNPATSECQKGLEASRKVWEKYHDGQAPISTPKLDMERKKLADEGFKPSYWISEVSPGRNSEYWVNETTQKTMYIVWEIQGNKWVMTEKTDYEMGKNPAPSNK